MTFEQVSKINVNEYAEKKNGLTYLSWAHAWNEFCKIYPEATYEIKKNEFGVPAFGDSEMGYTVYTTVTVGTITREMWLPVMDFKNKSMMNPTTFDVNKAVMRCLTKNLAMFGLGIYIYAGEDLPEPTDTDRPVEKPKATQPKPSGDGMSRADGIAWLSRQDKEIQDRYRAEYNASTGKNLTDIKFLTGLFITEVSKRDGWK